MAKFAGGAQGSAKQDVYYMSLKASDVGILGPNQTNMRGIEHGLGVVIEVTMQPNGSARISITGKKKHEASARIKQLKGSHEAIPPHIGPAAAPKASQQQQHQQQQPKSAKATQPKAPGGQAKPCFDFQKGECKRGDRCLISHVGLSRNSGGALAGGGSNSSSGGWSPLLDGGRMSAHVQAFWNELCKRFTQIGAKKGDKTAGGGSRAPIQTDQYEVWMDTWRVAASGCNLDGVGDCPELVLPLTYLRLPAIQHVSPPVGDVVEVLVRVLNVMLQKKSLWLSGFSGVTILEAIIDIVRDRLCNQLDQVIDGEALEQSLDKLSAGFQKAILLQLQLVQRAREEENESARLGVLLQRGREISGFKTECLRYHKSAAGSAFDAGQELEMSLTGKVPEPWSGWRQASLGWLMSGSFVDVGKGLKAVYASPEEYAETLLRMWTLLTFYWGGGAVFPKCSHRQHEGGKMGGAGGAERGESTLCGNPLLEPCIGDHACGKCGAPGVWKCCRPNHDAMCAKCVITRQNDLVGQPGVKASTDIYDARVEREGHRAGSYVYFLGGLQSRKPPTIATNWKTSYRLPVAGLVGIVRLAVGRERLDRRKLIEWAEIVSYDARGGSTVDWQSRQVGKLAIRLLNAGDCPGMRGEAATALEAGSMVAIVDLRVFVPEVISVLATFAAESFAQSLKEIPFIGRLIGNKDPQKPFAMHHGQSARDLITTALTRSEIEQIARLPFSAREELAARILNIYSVKSLYGTQLEAFVSGLFSSVHCTQGPPGTGKSYLGVCLALALDLIRTKLQETMAVGPILVLSYKNHALDEFLMDLVNAARTSNNPLQTGMLIRSGNPELPGLEKFREKTSTVETRAKDELELRVGVQKRLKSTVKDWIACSKVLLSQAEMLVDGEEDALGFIPAWAAEQKRSAGSAHGMSHGGADVKGSDVVLAVCCALSLLGRLKAAYSLSPGGEVVYIDALGPEAGYKVAAKAFSVDIASAGFGIIVAEISALLPQLMSNIEHWKMTSDEPWFRLLLIVESWLKGRYPPPRCSAMIGEERCPHECTGDNDFCDSLHRCFLPDCSSERVPEHTYCRDHYCASSLPCDRLRSKLGGTLCDDHLCLGCVQSGSPTILARAPLACPLHCCQAKGCRNLQIVGFDFCSAHLCTVCATSGFLPGQCRMDPFQPLCSLHKCSVETCTVARASGELPFCAGHMCFECFSLGDWHGVDFAYPDSQLCPDHRCSHIEVCPLPRNMSSLFCVMHSCKVCLLFASADNIVSDVVLDDAPRNSCANHPLCNKVFRSGIQCCITAEPPGLFCSKHNKEEEKPKVGLAVDGQCWGISKNSKKRCGTKLVPPPKSEGRWYCPDHIGQKPKEADDDTDESVLQEDEFHRTRLQSLEHSIEVQKQRLAEEARILDIIPYCLLLQCTRRSANVRCAVEICVPIAQLPKGKVAWMCTAHSREPRIPKNPSVSMVASLPTPSIITAEVVANDVFASSPPLTARATDAEPAPAYESAAAEAGADSKQGHEQSVNKDDFNEAERGDVHPDEMDYDEGEDEGEDEENEDLRRIRDQTELDMDEGDDDEDEVGSADALASSGIDTNHTLDAASLDEHAALLAYLSELSWELTPAERMLRASTVVRHASRLLVQLLRPVETHIAHARRDVAEAAAHAYRVTRFIGATVIGAARRLEAIRAAQPFAVIVEEACEVMEPTLMSVLAVKSLRKLEMIGDHRQLPAFVQNCWFNLESTTPSIKVSLFERLISGGVDARSRGYVKRGSQAGSTPLPFSILDEQRRMRREIADITRPDYADVITITDHPHTFQQRIGDRVGEKNVRLTACRALWACKGRSVPGVSPSVFFWDLANNKQSRPTAGLSACNQTEAEAVAGLVKYLFTCGVPASCISIITPYKGQQRTINQELRKRKLTAFYDKANPPPPGTTLSVSTVDRYQGDENDIVILSLVRVQPGNRFVALHNRFVVATSRARMGFFVVGSTSGVIHPEGAERARGPAHWRRFVKSLEGGDISPEDDEEVEAKGAVWSWSAAAAAHTKEEDKDEWSIAPERWAEGVSVYLINAHTALARVSKENVEFNHAAAQFAKLCGMAIDTVVAVWAIEYSPTARVAARYERKREALLTDGRGADEILVFHGTPYANIRPIVSGGFKVGGEGVRIANGAAHGKGVYTAIGSGTPMGYSTTGTSVILAHGLLGSQGVDHTIPHSDWRIFKDASQLLPKYIVVYGNGDPVVEARAAVARSLAQALYEEVDDIEENEKENLVFCQGVGAGLPICCPQHAQRSRPTKIINEVAQFPDATSWGAFCSAPCTHRLPCGHGCSLPCHAPSVEKHNERCEYIFERPCVRHQDVPLLCVDIKRRGNQQAKDSLTAFQCCLPEEYSRPECQHKVDVKCHRLDTLEAGAEQLPACEVLVGDYVHPTCNHVFPKPKCAVRRGYERHPPKCKTKVKFTRPCGCLVEAACFEWQLETSNPPECLQDVTFARPRCSHGLSLRCFQRNLLLQRWDAQDGDSAAVGASIVTVEAGAIYGPPESNWIPKIPPCQVPVTFFAGCGHKHAEIPCCKAFGMAAGNVDPPVCKESVAFPCPVCRHDIRVPCWAARALADWKLLAVETYIHGANGTGVREQAIQPARDAAQQNPLPKKLASLLRHACSQVLSLSRTCDAAHGVAIKCSSLLSAIWGTSNLPRCVFGFGRTLECGHVLEVPCHTKNGPEPICQAAVAEIFTYPCGVHTVRPEMCCRLQALRADSALRCLEPVETRRFRCGHEVKVKCCDTHLAERSRAGSKFSPGDKVLIDIASGAYCDAEDLPEKCCTGVTLLYPCGHVRPNMPCHEAFSIAERPESSRCEVLVTAESPLCLHSVCLPCCHTEALNIWAPFLRGRPEVRQITEAFEENGAEVTLQWMDESEIREYQFRAFERAHALPVCCERTVVTRRCGHRARVSCSDAYACTLGQCIDPIDLTCERCLFERRVPCHVNENELALGTRPPCANLMNKLCSHCGLNDVMAQCYQEEVRCNTVASTTLPCGHQFEWRCGKDPDPRTSVAKCRSCLLALWDASISRAAQSLNDDEAEDSTALGKLIAQLRPRLEHRLPAIGEVIDLVDLIPKKRQLDMHLKGRSVFLKAFRDLVAMSASVDDMGPPPSVGFDSYDIVFTENRAQSGFENQKQTIYGRGYELSVLSASALAALKPNAQGRLQLTLGLAFRHQPLHNPAPFRRPLDKVNKNDKQAEEQKANQLAESRKKAGFDCVQLHTGSGDRVVYWTVGAALPLISVEIKLTCPCCLCFEPLSVVDGASCPKGHLICFDCLGKYAKSQHDGDEAVGNNVNNEGKLTCPDPECRAAYDCKQLAIRGSPDEVLEAIAKITTDRATRLAVEKAVAQQERKLRAEFESIMKIQDLHERKAHQIRQELVGDVFNLKCPRCKTVFADFDGCFALTCGNQLCKCGFCAWCLEDCGHDAHAHVPTCPEGNRSVYGKKEDFHEHHRKKRERTLRERFGRENSDVQRHLRNILEKDLKDWGITIPAAGAAAARVVAGGAVVGDARAGDPHRLVEGLMGWINDFRGFHDDEERDWDLPNAAAGFDGAHDDGPGFRDGDFEEDM